MPNVEDFLKAQKTLSLKKIGYYKQSIGDGIDPEVLQNRIVREQRIIDCDFSKYQIETTEQAQRAIDLVKRSKDTNYDALFIEALAGNINPTKYSQLSDDDQRLIDEYKASMSIEDVNNLMDKMLTKYQNVEVKEEIKTFDHKTGSIDKFVNFFVTTTDSQQSINEFFLNKDNFNFVVDNIGAYTSNDGLLLNHISKHFVIKKKLRILLEDNSELISIIFDACKGFFQHREEENKIAIYGYISNAVRNILLKRIDKGYNCVYCNSIYSKYETDKKTLISCASCKNKFMHVFAKCPDCDKRVPFSSIDRALFDKNEVKHALAFNALEKYVDKDSIRYLSEEIGISFQEATKPFKIKISGNLLKSKINMNKDYELGDNFSSTVPLALHFMPLICPISTGVINKNASVKGCGKQFLLKDGLKQTEQGEITVYSPFEQRQAYYKSAKRGTDNVDEVISSSYISADQYEDNETKRMIPFDRAFCYIDDLINAESSKEKKNVAMLSFYLAMKEYIVKEYTSQLDFMLNEYAKQEGFVPKSILDEVEKAKNPEEIKSNKELANMLFYNNTKHKIGWMPTNDAKREITQLYINIIGESHGHIRQVNDATLPLKFYTYFSNNKVNKQNKKKTRIGIAIDKEVLPATRSSKPGYGQNFRTDNNNVSVVITHNGQETDVSKYVKNVAYWSPKNSSLHGFDNRTGIIWFEGNADNNVWNFPDGVSIIEGSFAKINMVSTGEGYSKMMLRADFNGKIKDILSQLENDGINI